MPYQHETTKLAEQLLNICRVQEKKITTAESCTGGLITGLLTEIPGSSEVVDRGFVTYSNDAKIQMLNVDQSLIEEHGAVSEQVARAMATGALENSNSDIAVAVTGVAGPGESENKPAGLVYIAVTDKTLVEPIVMQNNFTGNRHDVRVGSVNSALFLALSLARKKEK